MLRVAATRPALAHPAAAAAMRAAAPALAAAAVARAAPALALVPARRFHRGPCGPPRLQLSQHQHHQHQQRPGDGPFRDPYPGAPYGGYEPPGRGALKTGMSVAAGVLAFSLVKPLFFLVVGGAVGVGTYHFTRAWLDTRFPPHGYGGYPGGAAYYGAGGRPGEWVRQDLEWAARELKSAAHGAHSAAASGPAPPAAAAPFVRDPAEQMWGPLATPFRRLVSSLAGPTSALRMLAVDAVAREPDVRAAVLRAVGLPTDATGRDGNTVEFTDVLEASQAHASVSGTGAPADAARGTVEVAFDAVAPRSGQTVRVRAGGDFTPIDFGRLFFGGSARPDKNAFGSKSEYRFAKHAWREDQRAIWVSAWNRSGARLHWIQVGDGPKVALVRDAAEPSATAAQSDVIVEGKAAADEGKRSA